MSLDSETGSGEMAAADPADPAPPAGGGRRRQLLLAAGGAVAVVLLYLAYLGQSRSQGADSDAASNVLQAWDMLHGNLLLRHWSLSDVSF